MGWHATLLTPLSASCWSHPYRRSTDGRRARRLPRRHRHRAGRREHLERNQHRRGPRRDLRRSAPGPVDRRRQPERRRTRESVRSTPSSPGEGRATRASPCSRRTDARRARRSPASRSRVVQGDRLCCRSLVLLDAPDPDLVRHEAPAPDVAGPPGDAPDGWWQVSTVGEVSLTDPGVGPAELAVWTRFAGGSPTTPSTSQAHARLRQRRVPDRHRHAAPRRPRPVEGPRVRGHHGADPHAQLPRALRRRRLAAARPHEHLRRRGSGPWPGHGPHRRRSPCGRPSSRTRCSATCRPGADVDLELDDDQIALADSVRAGPRTRVACLRPARALVETGSGAEAPCGDGWSTSTGRPSAWPESDGGMGYGTAEAALVHEGCGSAVVRRARCSPPPPCSRR